ncbi:hypothetical protein CDD82_7789 [Ophiocordyceps australis]|uniref:RING-type domain-containing protein n=1 Tax=Ophiocordyceps australis TaxID=1399860 RepID=A0A2C5YIP5_9HYPO|nr:hypothetical protein CDD82_7789 [Ophiocordyceps australis]
MEAKPDVGQLKLELQSLQQDDQCHRNGDSATHVDAEMAGRRELLGHAQSLDAITQRKCKKSPAASPNPTRSALTPLSASQQQVKMSNDASNNPSISPIKFKRTSPAGSSPLHKRPRIETTPKCTSPLGETDDEDLPDIFLHLTSPVADCENAGATKSPDTPFSNPQGREAPASLHGQAPQGVLHPTPGRNSSATPLNSTMEHVAPALDLHRPKVEASTTTHQDSGAYVAQRQNVIQAPNNPLKLEMQAAPFNEAPQDGIRPFQHSNATASPGLNMPHMNSDGRSLAQVILSTQSWDLETGLDQNGNALPQRLFGVFADTEHVGVSEKELDALLQNIQPEIDVSEKAWEKTPAGLKNPLYPHQELALSWMKKLEEGTNKGGILADDMGLGKTISTLALLLERPGSMGKKTNLIITPLSLLDQWKEEITKKVKLSHRMSIFIHHNTKTTAETLMKYDVVLTTYGTVAAEARRYEVFLRENKDRNIDYNSSSLDFKFPLLHPIKARFYRIILDEAQCIKNQRTLTAKACSQLRATHRWCLTGTPLMNNIKELFSLVHFLRIRPYCSWTNFRQAFGKLCGDKGQALDSRAEGMDRLRALLKAIMLRRMKTSQLNGQPILKLPPKKEHSIYATLTSRERQNYDKLEAESQAKLRKIIRENTLNQNYVSILVMLTRMRFACCHRRLNVRLEEAKAEHTMEMKMYARGLGAPVVDRIKATDAFECPVCLDAVGSPWLLNPCGHALCTACCCSIIDEAVKNNLQAGEESEQTKCPVCSSAFDSNKCVTLEAFQDVHMPEVAAQRKNDDFDDSDNDYDSDLDECLGNDTKAETHDAEGDEKGDQASGADEHEFKLPQVPQLSSMVLDAKREQQAPENKSPQDHAKEKDRAVKNSNASKYSASTLRRLRVNSTKGRNHHARYMNYLRETWVTSSKVRKCIKLLKKLDERGEKTIVFSQWTLFLDLIQVAMWHEGFSDEPERYDGTMTADERARAVHDFRYRRSCRVMLVSLRAGNTGLNLTSATSVIIMDPFWNPYVEMQAVDRAHRIGQQRPVNVYRILTQETVEDRIVELQEKKKEIIEAALDEHESRKIGRLQVRELKFLFNVHN